MNLDNLKSLQNAMMNQPKQQLHGLLSQKRQSDEPPPFKKRKVMQWYEELRKQEWQLLQQEKKLDMWMKEKLCKIDSLKSKIATASQNKQQKELRDLLLELHLVENDPDPAFQNETNATIDSIKMLKAQIQQFEEQFNVTIKPNNSPLAKIDVENVLNPQEQKQMQSQQSQQLQQSQNVNVKLQLQLQMEISKLELEKMTIDEIPPNSITIESINRSNQIVLELTKKKSQLKQVQQKLTPKSQSAPIYHQTNSNHGDDSSSYGADNDEDEDNGDSGDDNDDSGDDNDVVLEMQREYNINTSKIASSTTRMSQSTRVCIHVFIIVFYLYCCF